MLAIQADLGWTDRGRRRGGRRRRRRDDRGLARPGLEGAAPGPAPCRPAPQAPGRRRAGGRAEQGLGQDRVRGASSRSSRSGGPTRSARPRRPWPASSPRPSSAARSSTRPPTSSSRRSSSRSASVATSRLKKVEEIYPARIDARKEKYDADKKQLDESYRKTKDGHRAGIHPAWQTLIDDWTGGMGRIDEALRGVNEEASRRFLDWTQPELDGWKPPDGGPARPAVRRLLGRPRASSPTACPATRGSSRCRPTSTCPPCCPSPSWARMLIRAADGGKDQAIPCSRR